MNKLVIKKHSALIQTNAKNLTLTQRKIINFFIYAIQQQGDHKIYHTNINNLKELCNIKSTENIDLKSQQR